MNVCNFADTLKALRTSKSMSQEQLGQRLRISKAVISKYETGLSNPSFDKLVLIAKFFGVSTDYLLGVEKNESIDVSRLTDSQKAAVYTIVSEFREANKLSDY